MKNTRMKCYGFKGMGMGFQVSVSGEWVFFSFRGNGFSVSGEWVLGWMLGKNTRMKTTRVRVSFPGLGFSVKE